MQDQNDNSVVEPTQVPEPQDVPLEQPVAEGQDAPQEPEQEQQVETLVEQTVEPSQQTPAYDPADIDISQYAPQQVQQVQPDEDGYIDPQAYRQSILQEVKQTLAFEKQEAKAWEAIENKYSDIKDDRELRDLVEAQRLADVARGGTGNLSKIADQVMGKITSYQQKGKVQAQVSETVQKSAGLQTATANKVDSSKDGDLIERMSRGDEAAQHELISSWIADGKIQ